ncbi:MAG TPA: SdpI family protein [Gemmatimonadales bacterium]|nr:SdpI family protein [Gemmatimonadales bacterium]
MRSRWFGLLVALAAVAATWYAWDLLPPRMATHWDASGHVNGWSPRAFGAFFAPGMIVALTLLFQVLPALDPRRQNYEKFIHTYWVIANSVLLFLGVVHGMILANALGYNVAMTRVVPLGMGVLFIALGNVLPRVEPNWFVGIRTPWTLSSDTVWRKTHRTGGWTFFLGGCALLIEGVIPLGNFWPVMVATVAAAALIPVVQSYLLWKGEQGGQV